MNLIRITFLTFALGILSTPLLDNSGLLEEFALSMAEDVAAQDAYLALPQFNQPSDHLSFGPIPCFASLNRITEALPQPMEASSSGLYQSPEGALNNRPLYLLYHNFRFCDCLS